MSDEDTYVLERFLFIKKFCLAKQKEKCYFLSQKKDHPLIGSELSIIYQ